MPRKKTKKGTAARARTKKRRRVRIKTELIGLPQNRLWQIIHLEDSITWCNKLGLIALQIEIQNFRAWPYWVYRQLGDFSLGRGPVGGSASWGSASWGMCQLGEVPVGGL